MDKLKYFLKNNLKIKKSVFEIFLKLKTCKIITNSFSNSFYSISQTLLKDTKCKSRKLFQLKANNSWGIF